MGNRRVINTFLRHVLKPKMRDGHTYFFTSYFLSTLLHTGPSGRNAPRYEYNAVRRWGKTLRRANGILGVKEIFVPINCRCEHWLFLRANTTDKTVVLWDSQGVKQSNQLYLDTMVQYLKDKYNELTGHPVAEWTRLWRKIDDSGQSPRQNNGYDCGIFTLASISLLAQKIPLTTRSYTEAELHLHDTRKRIALLLWQASHNHPRQRPRSATSSRTPPSFTSTTRRPQKTSSRHSVPHQTSRLAAKERNKRRRQRRKQNLVLGGTRTRGKIHSSDLAQTQQLSTLINRKRSAASVAEGQASTTAITQRHAPPKKRKRKQYR